MSQQASTIDEWARDYVLSEDLTHKLTPPRPPSLFSELQVAVPSVPGRPEALQISKKAYKVKGQHRSPRARAKAAHTFLHHELQATELMLWCLLRFPQAPQEFRRGLLNVALDEIRHMQMYEEYIRELGFEVGAFSVRDWFWRYTPECTTPTQFVSTMGLGFEAANLDHADRFEGIFRAADDHKGAALCEKVGREEVGHVAFAVQWYLAFEGPLKFEEWAKQLPGPWSPMLMRGKPLHRKRRLVAGMDDAFCDALVAWQPS